MALMYLLIACCCILFLLSFSLSIISGLVGLSLCIISIFWRFSLERFSQPVVFCYLS
jgi:hypothetical protein